MKKNILTKTIFIIILFFTTNIKSKYFIYKIENHTNLIAHITLSFKTKDVELDHYGIDANVVTEIEPQTCLKYAPGIRIESTPHLIYFEENSEILNYFTISQNKPTELTIYEANSSTTRTTQKHINPQKSEFLKIIIHEDEIEVLLILKELKCRDLTITLLFNF